MESNQLNVGNNIITVGNLDIISDSFVPDLDNKIANSVHSIDPDLDNKIANSMNYVVSNVELHHMLSSFNTYFKTTNAQLIQLKSELENLKSDVQRMRKKIQVSANVGVTTDFTAEAIFDQQTKILEKIEKIQTALNVSDVDIVE